MIRLATTFAAAAVTAVIGLSAPASAASPQETLPQEWLGELADARDLLESLKQNGTPARALRPAEEALECWAAAGADAITCRDEFFARVVDSSYADPADVQVARNAMGADMWMR
ncbi:hypothetical protein C882_2660 [Caenispirillum salinarum AK4]|uniref:Uncharacterized protein n=1 Tax=Caenispirillum salinarum AK4 TaxID=1238182 RepID=K9HWL3_9PROT|nr:hypothetical protein [Caenispirillum salinarum]EKV32581.1 hypothetical protein C882_2660 [Caenispirillum salinarum AK4]